MANKFLNTSSVRTLITELKNYIATKKDVETVKTTTDPYILNIDRSILTFDTSKLISDPIYDAIVTTRTGSIDAGDGGIFGGSHIVIDSSLFDYRVKQYALSIDDVSYTITNKSDNETIPSLLFYSWASSPDVLLLVIKGDPNCYLISLISNSLLGEEGSEHHIKITYLD